MKFLIVDTYYQSFLDNLRKKNASLSSKSYRVQLNFLLSQCFGTSDFYSSNLIRLGHRAENVIANDEVLQRKWAKENRVSIKKADVWSKFQSLPLLHYFIGRPSWAQQIVLEQVKKYRPDIVYLQDISYLEPRTLKIIKRYSKLIGQIAYVAPPEKYLFEYDLILTSFPHFVKKFRSLGIKSEYFKIGFEPEVLKRVGSQKRIYGVTFVGGFTLQHAKATKILEQVAREVRVDVWGRGVEFLSPTSPLRKHYHGEAWGLEMYKILAQSKITLNRHISVSNGYANNMRLYESTGMGAMLITDDKRNLNDLLKVGKEVVGYSDSGELAEKIDYYLKHEKEREKIAKAGQKRTLSDHTYQKRMKELVEILRKYL